MLVKEREPVEDDIQCLKDILSQNLSLYQRFLVERELSRLQSPQQGHLCATHFLNFHFQNSNDWAVIHDLQVKENGFYARFEHILINRLFEFYIFESENFPYGLKITPGGEFLVHDGHRYHPVQSPIEENRKHADILQAVLRENKILPRAGGSTAPEVKPYILHSPHCNLLRPPDRVFDSSMVVTIDALAKILGKQTRRMKGMFHKLCRLTRTFKKDPLLEVSRQLISLHTVTTPDYIKKFDLQKDACPPPPEIFTSDYRQICDYCI